MIIFAGCTRQEYPGKQTAGAYWKNNCGRQILAGAWQNERIMNIATVVNIQGTFNF